MNTGENLAGYLLLTPGAKSNHTEIWKAVKITDDLQEALENSSFEIESDLSDSKKIKAYEDLLEEVDPDNPPLTLSIFRDVHEEDAEKFQENYEILQDWDSEYLTRIDHSHYDRENKRYILVTEYLQGSTLNRTVAQRGPNGKWGLEASQKIIEFFPKVHEKGIIHGGLRPDSIVFSEPGSFKIRGFGVLNLLGGPMGSRAPRGPGALRFVPKELWEKETDPNILSDIYSLGMILYYLLSGTLPVRESKPSDIYSEISDFEEDFPSLGQKNPNLPATIVEIVDAMIQKNPENRWSWEKIEEKLETLVIQGEKSSEEEEKVEKVEEVEEVEKAKRDSPEESSEGVSEADGDDEGKEEEERGPTGEDFSLRALARQVDGSPEDWKCKALLLQDQLFSLLQKDKSLDPEITSRLEALSGLKENLEELVRRHQIIIDSAQQAVRQVEKLGTILEKNSAAIEIPEVPILDAESLATEEEFFCAQQFGPLRILGYLRHFDEALPVLTLEWAGEIKKQYTSDLRVQLAEIATQNAPLALLDFSFLIRWSEATVKLVAGFLAALASKNVHPLLFKASPELTEVIEERELAYESLESLDDLEGVVGKYRNKVVIILYPKRRDDFKFIAPAVEKFHDQGYSHFLVDLSSKAVRGDDMEELLEFHKLCQNSEIEGQICGVTDEMKTVFKIMDLHELQESYASAEKALEEMMGEDYYSVEIRDFPQ